MKIKAIVLLLVALFMANDSVRAQASDGVVLRYGENINTGYGNGGQIVTPYVTFSKSRMAPFIKGGCSVSAVRIGLAKPAKNVRIYIKYNAGDRRDVYHQTVGDLEAGWNTVSLTTPYQLTDSSLTVGYRATFESGNDGGAGFDTYASTYADSVYVNTSQTWRTIDGSFCIQPVISGGTLPENYAFMDPLPMEAYTYDSIANLKFLLRNEGTKKIDYCEYFLSNMSDSTHLWGTFIIFDSIGVNATDTVTVTLDPADSDYYWRRLAPTVGNNVRRIGLIKVNNDETFYEDRGEIFDYAFERRDPKFMQHVVVEDFTGDWCQFCVAGIEELRYLKSGYEHPEEIVPISIHVPTDPLALADNEYSYQPLLSQVEGFPTVYSNRTGYYTTSQPYGNVRRAVRMIEASAGTTGLSGEAHFNADSTALEVATSFVSASDIASPDYKIAFVLLEDSIDGSQYNGYSGGSSGSFLGWESLPQYVSMKYDDVARGVYNTFEGQPLVSGAITAGVPVAYTYSLDLTKCPVNDARYIHVVPMVLNSNGEIVNACNVYPSAGTPSGIRTLSNGKSDFNGAVDVYAVDGSHVGKFDSINSFNAGNMHGIFILRSGNTTIKVAR